MASILSHFFQRPIDAKKGGVVAKPEDMNDDEKFFGMRDKTGINFNEYE